MSVALRRYCGWLARRLFGHRKRPPRVVPAAVWPRATQPPLPTFGLDLVALRQSLSALSIDDGEPGASADYLNQDFERFLRTVDLVPADATMGLEIGANPYLTTLLLGRLRPGLRLSLTNHFGAVGGIHQQSVAVAGPSGPEEGCFAYHSVNIETDDLPFAPESFDVVLYCEVLEHMTNDPAATLQRIRRVLKQGGTLVLTTPNAARLENAARLMAGLNIYDQYSGHGPYGRHNREYTVEEVRALLIHSGFEEETVYTADVYDNHAALHVGDPRWLERLCGHRAGLLGQYIFSRWRRGDRAIPERRPAWLYRSLSDEMLSDEVPLTEPPNARY